MANSKLSTPSELESIEARPSSIKTGQTNPSDGFSVLANAVDPFSVESAPSKGATSHQEETNPANGEVELSSSNAAPESPTPVAEQDSSPSETTTQTSSPDRPIDASATEADFGILPWIIPVLVLLAVGIGLWIANRRRAMQPKIVIDTTKPIRGAFQKRNAMNAKSVPSLNGAIEGKLESVFPLETGESTIEGSREEEYQTHQEHGNEISFGSEFASESEPESAGLKARTDSTLNLNSGGRRHNAPDDGDDSEYMFFDDEATNHEEPASSARNAAGSTTNPSRQHPHLADSPSLEAESRHLNWNAIEKDPASDLNEDSAGSTHSAALVGTLIPSATQEEKPKSGVFKRWFGKPKDVSPDVISPMESTPLEVDKFQIPDEDLRSLFDKSPSESNPLATSDMDMVMDPGDPPVPGSFDLGPGEPDEMPADAEEFNLDFDSDVQLDVSKALRRTAELEEALAQMQLENQQLQESLQMAQRHLEGFTAQQDHQLEEHRLEQETAARELEKHQTTIARLEAEQLELLNASDSMRSELEERIRKMPREDEQISATQSIQTLEESVSQLQRELQSVIDQRDSLQQERDQSQAQLRTATQQGEAWSAELKQLQANQTEMLETLATTETQLQSLIHQNETLKLETQRVQQDYQQSLQHSADWEVQNESWNAELQHLQANNLELVDKLSATESNQLELVAQNEALELQIQKLRREHEQSLLLSTDWDVQRESWNSDLQQIRLEKQELLEKLSANENQYRELGKQYATAERQIHQLQQQLDLSLLQSKEWTQQRESSLTELQQLQADKIDLSKKLAETATHHRELARLSEEREIQIQQLRQEQDQMTTQIRHLQQQLSEFSERPAHNVESPAQESISRETKEKFTRLFKSYERERRLRKETEQFLTEAEQQIAQLRESLKQPKSVKTPKKPKNSN